MSLGKDAFQGWVVGWLLAVQSSVRVVCVLTSCGLCKVESVIDARSLCRSRPRLQLVRTQDLITVVCQRAGVALALQTMFDCVGWHGRGDSLLWVLAESV